MPDRAFRALLALLPRAFRESFGDEMRLLFDEQHAAARRSGAGALALFWWRTAAGMLSAAWRERRGLRQQRCGLPWHETLLSDVRLAGRLLVRAPLFTALVVTAIAVGTGGVATVFSALNAIVLRPLPGTTDGSRLIMLDRRTPDGSEGVSASYGFYRHLSDNSQSLSGVVAWSRVALTVSRGTQGHAVPGTIVSGNYFSVLGMQPAAGRFFLPEEDTVPLAYPVIVVSHAFWTTHLHADPGAIGGALMVNGQPYRLIGVAPAGFHGVFTPIRLDAWVPLAMQPHVRPGRDLDRAPWLWAFGRMRDGVTEAQTRAELSALTERWVASGGGEAEGFRRYTNMRVTPLTGLPDDARRALLGFGAVLLGASLLVLVIAGANVSSLLTARAVARRREMGVRVALGASRGRLIRQLLTETMALFLLGGIGGTVFAAAATSALERMPLPGDAALGLELSPDVRVVIFSIAISLVAGAVFGAGPALRGVGRNPGALLRAQSAGAGRRTLVANVTVVAQVACSLVLLTAAALFIRSVAEGDAVDPRFDPSGVAVASFNSEAYGYDAVKGQAFYDTLRRRLEASPAVEQVTFAGMIPLTFSDSGTTVTIDRAGDGHSLRMPVRNAAVDAKYFATLRIPLLFGRDFSAADAGGQPIAIVNDTFARRAWGEPNAVGRTFAMGSRRIVVAGVARDSRYASLTEGAVAFVYLPIMQSFESSRTLFVRARPGFPPPAAAIETEVLAMDSLLPRPLVRSLSHEIRGVLFPQRVAAIVTGVLGGLGLLLAAIGLYGLVAYGVRLRLREIGVRIALGARAGHVIWLVVFDALRLSAAGIALGLIGAVVAGSVVASYLVRVSSLDPLAFCAAAGILVVTALVAAYLPARRAAKADPLTILRME
ncbi:MAG: ABC transporter permease [Vicinamibacterales bacterium]